MTASGRLVGFLKRECSGWHPAEAGWFAFCLLSVCALSLWWGDSALSLFAALSGIAYTVLAGKGKISCFAFGLLNTPIYAYVAFRCGYYGDMALNVYYFAMMFPGLWAWRRNVDGGGEGAVVRRALDGRGRVLCAAATALGAAALYPVLVCFGGSRPLCDAFTNVLSIAAMVLTVRRCIEQWIMWIAVDLIEVFMWWRVWTETGNSVSVLLMWLLFLANGFYLWRLWAHSIYHIGGGVSVKVDAKSFRVLSVLGTK